MANPEIPSFKNPQGGGGEPPKDPPGPPLPKGGSSAGTDEKKGSGLPLFGKSAPKAPSFGGAAPAGGTPSLKIRGLAGGPKTLFERLKQFQKKDLVFIASGMGVLFLAPLAEHFMMSPTQDPAKLGPNFGSQGSGSPFGNEVGPTDTTGGLNSPGNLYGASTDVITPLNVRDPSALVMAPGASQVTPPPNGSVVAPAAAGPARDSGGWKDALSAAKSGVEKGADAAKPAAFKAPGNLAGALRGLSALSGGSYGGGPSFNLGAPNASNVPNRSGEGGRLSQVKSAPGYKGVGQRGLDSGGGGAEALRKAAEGQGNLFNRPGSAAGNLDAAAREAIPTGSGQGGGGAGAGGENKGGSGSTSKDNKALGESLAYLRMKMEMEKEMDLKWAKKKWKEFEFPKMIYEEITKSAIQNIVGKGMFEPFGKGMAKMWDPKASAPAGIYCTNAKQTIDLGNDGSVAYHCGGAKGAYSRSVKDGEETGPIQEVGCEICTEYGGGAKPTPPASGGGGNTNRPIGAPGTTNPPDSSGERTRNSERIQTGRQTIDAFIGKCGQNQAQQDPNFQRACQAANLAKPIYETHLPNATEANNNANTLMTQAWSELKNAAAAMKAAEKQAFDFANKLGCAKQGSTRECAADTVLTKSRKVRDELDAAMAAADANDLTTANQALENAKKALQEAKGLLANPAAPDQRPLVRAALDNAEARLKEATAEVVKGVKAIRDAETVIRTTDRKLGEIGAAERTQYRDLQLKPAEDDARSLMGQFSEKAGEAVVSGGAKADPGSAIGLIDRVRSAQADPLSQTACGKCTENAGMVGDAVAAHGTGTRLTGQTIPDPPKALTPPQTPGQAYRALYTPIATTTKEGADALENTQIPALDKSMKAVNSRPSKEQDGDPIKTMVECTASMKCTPPAAN